MILFFLLQPASLKKKLQADTCRVFVGYLCRLWDHFCISYSFIVLCHWVCWCAFFFTGDPPSWGAMLGEPWLFHHQTCRLDNLCQGSASITKNRARFLSSWGILPYLFTKSVHSSNQTWTWNLSCSIIFRWKHPPISITYFQGSFRCHAWVPDGTKGLWQSACFSHCGYALQVPCFVALNCCALCFLGGYHQFAAQRLPFWGISVKHRNIETPLCVCTQKWNSTSRRKSSTEHKKMYCGRFWSHSKETFVVPDLGGLIFLTIFGEKKYEKTWSSE